MDNAGDMSTIYKIIPTCLLNPELQAVIFVGLACVGAWVIFTCLIQVFKYLYLFILFIYNYCKYQSIFFVCLIINIYFLYLIIFRWYAVYFGHS